MVSLQENADQNGSSDKEKQQVNPQQVNPQAEIAFSQGVDDVPKNESSDSDVNAMANELPQSPDSSPLETHFQSLGTPSNELLPSQSSQRTFAIIREKVTSDGFNWRKYGQKNLKTEGFKRCYYKCSHSNCLAKKKFVMSPDGNFEGYTYTGQHSHSKPQSNTVPPVDPVLPVLEQGLPQSSLANVEGQDKSSVEYESTPQQISPLRYCPPSNASETHDSKRLRKDDSNTHTIGGDMSTGEFRLVVHTPSESGVVDDGYRWRKYGQKNVKGNENPRNYYRCTSPGCHVKKHVERSPENPINVITTYEGEHDHEPPTRRFPCNTSKPKHKSGGNNVCADMVSFQVVVLPNGVFENNIYEEEQQNEDPSPKDDPEEEQQNEDPSTKDDPVSNNTVIREPSTEVPCRSNEHDTVIVSGHDTPRTTSELKKVPEDGASD
ncbi:unnamed protein product [Lathyrus sativus]|nr:unnamed protein product [Lathyrus sativus]